jgi:acetamidase/formamidase
LAYTQTIAEWDCDIERGLVTLVSPGIGPEGLSIPLEPMLGCFGVAPAGGQVISAVTCGEHGGNMDYRGFGPGVTAYFPVAVEGALFSLGDGHAAQGDGEIVGSGVEISMEAEFTVRVVKGELTTWPRGETEDLIFTVGNARPLDQALQHATSEMFRWLRTGFGLDAVAASVLLGQCVEYAVGNVYSPAFTLVCSLPKKHLGDGSVVGSQEPAARGG